MDTFSVNKTHYDTIASIVASAPNHAVYASHSYIEMTNHPHITLQCYDRDYTVDKAITIQINNQYTSIFIHLYSPDNTLEEVKEIEELAVKYTCFMYRHKYLDIYMRLTDKSQKSLSYALQHIFDSVDTGLTKRAK